MREIILDTESTGLDPEKGHRLVEIGCVELINRIPTGRIYHTYLNPEREVPEEAVRVHNLTYDFLKDKPLFSQIHEEFLSFLGEDQLVIHNAGFDLKFLNAEFSKVGGIFIAPQRAIDTLTLARKKFPGSPANLDALCSRFKIDRTHRTYHGALLDARLLAEVYIELLGGSQIHLSLAENKEETSSVEDKFKEKEFKEARFFTLPAQEVEEHESLLKKMKDPLWKKYA